MSVDSRHGTGFRFWLEAPMFKNILLILAFWLAQGCVADLLNRDEGISESDKVQIPFLRNSPNECYYLDEFMPVPDGMVAGKHGRLNLRYYTYKAASYKDWDQMHIVLAFYSQDDHCWSLFEEAYVNR